MRNYMLGFTVVMTFLVGTHTASAIYEPFSQRNFPDGDLVQIYLKMENRKSCWEETEARKKERNIGHCFTALTMVEWKQFWHFGKTDVS